MSEEMHTKDYNELIEIIEMLCAVLVSLHPIVNEGSMGRYVGYDAAMNKVYKWLQDNERFKEGKDE